MQRTQAVGQVIPGVVNLTLTQRTCEVSSQPVAPLSFSQTVTDDTAKVEFPYEYRAAAAIGRGITGQRSYPVSPETNPEYWHWNKRTFEVAKQEGLDPFDVVYWVCQRDALLQAASRNGFPANISHWKNGMEFYELTEGHRYRNQRIYELIVNNNPSHAYLLDGNELIDQKLVMCHCMGHSDFFKNNIHFRHTNRNMMNRIAEHAVYQRQVLDEENVGYEEMEKFLEIAYSIEDLIDYSDLNPRQLKFELQQERTAEKIPDDFGMVPASDMPGHIQKRLNAPERLQHDREVEKTRLDIESRKIPKHPDYDVIGFIIENSKVLKPWQRQMLMNIREQSYYIAPQGLTKIMNEGWAVYWHNKLMAHPEIVDLKDASSFAEHNAGTIALSPGRINPYRVGWFIFQDIEERWNTGRHGKKWAEIEDERERRDYDDKSMKGKEKIFDVRKWYKDTTFIDEYLTFELAQKLKLFTYENTGEHYEIASREFQVVKNELVGQLHRMGKPAIAVIDGNFGNKGELLLQHDFDFELKKDYALETLKNMLSLWGNTVHLNTKLLDDDKLTPVRMSVESILITNNNGAKPGTRIVWRKLQEHKKDDGSVEYYPEKDVLNEVVEEAKS